MHRQVYLDYNATAPMRQEVAAVMRPLLSEPLNASSVHYWGREARRHIERARQQVAATIGCEAAHILFTASATEANNLALRGVEATQVLVSAIEHPSVRRAVDYPVLLPVTPDGVVDVPAAARLIAISPRGALVSVMLANNETGAIQPVRAIAEIAHAHGALVHCDAVQAFGKMPLDFSALGVDMLTVSSHKVGGPLGAAALVIGPCLALTPLLRGGGQEMNRRAGTENVAAIAGFGVMAELARTVPPPLALWRQWRDSMEAVLRDLAPGARVMSAETERLPSTSCLTMPGVSSETQLMAFDLEGIAVSAGAACSSGRVEISPVLTAMGVGAREASTAIRVSTGWATQEEDLEQFIAAWGQIYARCGQRHGAAHDTQRAA